MKEIRASQITRLLSIIFQEHNSSLIKLPDESDCGPCRLIQFYEVNKRQFCAVVTKKNEIHIMEVGESGPDVVHTIKPKENDRKNRIKNNIYDKVQEYIIIFF